MTRFYSNVSNSSVEQQQQRLGTSEQSYPATLCEEQLSTTSSSLSLPVLPQFMKQCCHSSRVHERQTNVAVLLAIDLSSRLTTVNCAVIDVNDRNCNGVSDHNQCSDITDCPHINVTDHSQCSEVTNHCQRSDYHCSHIIDHHCIDVINRRQSSDVTVNVQRSITVLSFDEHLYSDERHSHGDWHQHHIRPIDTSDVIAISSSSSSEFCDQAPPFYTSLQVTCPCS